MCSSKPSAPPMPAPPPPPPAKPPEVEEIGAARRREDTLLGRKDRSGTRRVTDNATVNIAGAGAGLKI